MGLKKLPKQQHHHRKNKTYTPAMMAPPKSVNNSFIRSRVAVGRLSDACGQRLHNRQVGDRRKSPVKGRYRRTGPLP